MKVSVLIPAWNCSKTIEATLDSALRQTAPPYEILVMDDGSTDDTPAILDRYKTRVAIFHQSNRGLGSALDALYDRATGDLIARLDADDIWHPRYLEVQVRLFEARPTCVAFFAGHINFSGYGNYAWDSDPAAADWDAEIISPLDFIKRYNTATGPFTCMSYCCVPKIALQLLGAEPFRLRKGEDIYFLNRLARFGSIAYCPLPLVAYRANVGSLQSDLLVASEFAVDAFELVESYYRTISDMKLVRMIGYGSAVRRRKYAKFLLGAGQTEPARRQLWLSMRSSNYPKSVATSLALLVATFLPRRFQPKWPSDRHLGFKMSDDSLAS